MTVQYPEDAVAAELLPQIRNSTEKADATEYTETTESWVTKKTFANAIVVPAGEIWILAAVFLHNQYKVESANGGYYQYLIGAKTIYATGRVTQQSWTVADIYQKPPTIPFVLVAGSYDLIVQLKAFSDPDYIKVKDLDLRLFWDRFETS